MDSITPPSRRRAAARVALLYALFGALWILFSDQLLLLMVNSDAQQLARLQTFKGWLFVAVTAALLYLLVKRALARQHQTEQEVLHYRRQAERSLQAINQELERRVSERTAQLEEANRELESFSYAVSHDLKSPLRAIGGFSQILLEDHRERLGEEARQLLDRIVRNVNHMHQLIGDLLAYSRMERHPPEIQSLDLPGLINRLMRDQDELFAESGIHLETQLPPLRVRADREGLTVALRNLLENACKFSRNSPAPRIELGARPRDDHVELWIRDNGIGFDMREHDRIFTLFQRLQRSDEYPGTGIGLALVKKAMQRMGGQVWAESSPGDGATFYLALPRD